MQEQTSDVALVFPPPASPNVGYHGSGSCFLSTSPQGVLFPFVFWHVLCLLWSCTCFCIRRQALPRLVLRRRKALRRSCRRQLRVFLLRVFIIAFWGICFCDVSFLCRSGAFPAPPSPPAPAAGCGRSSCCFCFCFGADSAATSLLLRLCLCCGRLRCIRIGRLGCIRRSFVQLSFCAVRRVFLYGFIAW